MVVLACIPVDVYAASALDILDRQREEQRAAPKSKPIMQIHEDGTPTGADQSTEITLGSLEISGNTVFSSTELFAPWQQLYSQRVSLARINEIATALTKKYRDAGYLLSRVVIPQQEIDETMAVIRFIAVEGFVESVQYAGDARILERFKSYFSGHEKALLGKKPLRHSDFERVMLLMQDVPGLKIGSRFERGSLPGGSVLHIDVEGDLVEGIVSWGNTGTDESGPGIGSVTLGLNTLPVMGNRATVTYSQANNHQEYWSIQVADKYQMPNGLTFSLSYAFSDSPRQDSEFARDFDYNTNSTTWNFGVSYPVVRSRDFNLYTGLNYEQRNSDSWLSDEDFNRDRLRTLSVYLNLDFSDALGGVTQIIPTIYKGLNVFDATHKSFDATNTLAPADFWKFDLYISRNQELPRNFSIYACADLQLSNSSLASFHRFSLGGSQFGRGYKPGILEGDNGFAVSLEPRYTLHPTDRTTLQFFGFIDYGTVWTSEEVWGQPNWEDAASAGGGLRLMGHVGNDILPDFSITAYIGVPLKAVGEDNAAFPRFVLQAALTF